MISRVSAIKALQQSDEQDSTNPFCSMNPPAIMHVLIGDSHQKCSNWEGKLCLGGYDGKGGYLIESCVPGYDNKGPNCNAPAEPCYNNGSVQSVQSVGSASILSCKGKGDCSDWEGKLCLGEADDGLLMRVEPCVAGYEGTAPTCSIDWVGDPGSGRPGVCQNNNFG